MSLDEKVADTKENRGFIRKAGSLLWKLGMAAATTALSMAALPAIGASASLGIIVGGAFAGGGALGNILKGKSLYETVSSALTTYSGVNAVIAPMVWLGGATFPLIPNETIIGKAARTAYAMTAYNAAFVGQYRAATHLVDNYLSPFGITKSITNNFYNEWKRIGLGFGLAYGLDANGISTIMGWPTFALNALPLGFYNAVKPVPVKAPEAGKGYSPGVKAAPAPAH
ncbi:hypothetical protein HYS31_04610 [Candidatus Woesearchaeota archaeon]|nr:hypothetical protein [Candidatus Woesearchaeota archaeon]